jgi:pimeloyl-ACP methyl ester carboxylesterase
MLCANVLARASVTRGGIGLSAGDASEHVVATADGRLLMVERQGSADRPAVFLLHGTPGSRTGPRPRASVLYRLGVQLVSYDRPGYGASSRHAGRGVSDAAADVAAIADALGLERFSVVGRSGGGPHALACAALLSERIVRTAVLVGLAPSSAVGLDWFDGMTEANVRSYTTADRESAVLAERLRLQAERTAADPDVLLGQLRRQMTAHDRRAVSGAIGRLLHHTYGEALRHGPFGWVDDVLALRGDWGFPLESVGGPVLLWHGADDNFTPASHSRWLGSRIVHAEVRVQSDTAHFGAVEALPEILAWCTS